MSRKEVLEMLNDDAPLKPAIRKSDAKKFLVLQGDTQVNGFLWVIQAVVKGYNRSDVVAVAKNMSVFGIA